MAAKAFLVGINDYAPTGSGGPDLRGCVNDVRDAFNTFSAVLGIVPMRPPNLRVLTNAKATRENIMEGLEWLLKPVSGVERLIFYYSGHGSWVVDTNSDEVDGRDETICPHDYATAGMILDDDFKKLFNKLKPGITLEAFFDSCHSGTITKDLEANSTPPKERTFIPRFIEPPVDYAIFAEGNPMLPTRRVITQTDMAKQVVPDWKMNHIVWAACRSDQTAGEAPIGGVWRGVFSYNLFKILRRTGVAVARKRLDALVCTAVARMGYSQIPQLEANPLELNQLIFRDVVPREEVLSAAA